MEKAFELNLVGRLGPIHAGPGERNFRWKPTHRYGGHKQAEHGYDGKQESRVDKKVRVRMCRAQISIRKSLF